MSPRPPPKISYKDNWMCDLDSDIAGSSKDTQRIEPKAKTQLSSTGRPVCGHESTKRCVLTPKHVEDCQTVTGRPALVDQERGLQQNNVHNPFSKDSKEMIRELGNVELFELCETIPKVQFSHCLLYGNQGIVYCISGQCLIDSESRRKFNKLRLDALSIPNNVIKKGPAHGARTWQGRSTKRVPPGLECVEEMP